MTRNVRKDTRISASKAFSFFGIMAAVFAVLAVILFFNRRTATAAGDAIVYVDNITVIALMAASAVLCGVNLAGAVLVVVLDSMITTQGFDSDITRWEIRNTAHPKDDSLPDEQNKMYCPHCGARNNKDNETCFACGKPLSTK